MEKLKINGKNNGGGILQIIVLVIAVLLLMRYFGLTISGILDYFNLTWAEILSWLKKFLDWLKNLFNSVK